MRIIRDNGKENEIIVEKDQFYKLVSKASKKAYNNSNREPIGKLYNIPKEFIEWGNTFIYENQNKNIESRTYIEHLNAKVFAVAKTCSFFLSRKNLDARIRDKERSKKVKRHIC